MLYEVITAETHIQKAISEAMRNKTVIAIAHRLSTLRNMDKIVVMERGKIVEVGTHNELKKHGGTYAKLCRITSYNVCYTKLLRDRICYIIRGCTD